MLFVIFACSLHFAFWRKVSLGVAAGLVRFYCVLDQHVEVSLAMCYRCFLSDFGVSMTQISEQKIVLSYI